MRDMHKIVVIGTSVGGVAALRQIVSGLPADLPAVILIVIHIGGQSSILPELLTPYCPLPIHHARGGEPLEPGTILIAPPDHHMLVEPGRVLLTHGPKENFARPAIDPLFRSAALHYRDNVIGVVLTGNLDDGTVGAQAIKAYRGAVIVQDPAEAEAPSMPQSVIDHVEVDLCLPLSDIAATLGRLVKDRARQQNPAEQPAWIALENRFIETGKPIMDDMDKLGAPSMFTCPECHGSLWEVKGSMPPRFRCHTGHAFTARTLAAAQGQIAEEAIWAAVRALHEKESLLRRFAQNAADGQRMEAATEHDAAASQAARHAEILRKMIEE